MRAIVVAAPELSRSKDEQADGGFPKDEFNSPYARHRAILSALGLPHAPEVEGRDFELLSVVATEQSLELALLAHDAGLVEYLESAWARWEALGLLRCPDFYHDPASAAEAEAAGAGAPAPAFVPANGLFRDSLNLPGKSVHSQACYYHCDRITPIFAGLLAALRSDLAVVRAAASAVPWPLPDGAPIPPPVYALVTHPGHHATAATIGGYCYVNSAAVLARLLQRAAGAQPCRVAVLDVDYHFGNGTASIFYSDPDVLVASLHADPDTDYPFNCGFAEQSGAGAGAGTTLCVPLPPQTTWLQAGAGGSESYQDALRRALGAVRAHGAQALVVSLGVDAYAGDPVHLPGAGVKLQLADFEAIGALIAEEAKMPTWLIQEGGYMLDVVGVAVRNVLQGMLRAREPEEGGKEREVE